jgi:putative protease
MAGVVSFTAEGDEVAAARTKAITADEVVSHVGRLGGSGYRAGEWRIDLDANAGLGFSALHTLRREALMGLDARRLEPWASRERLAVSTPMLAPPAPRRTMPLLVATAWNMTVAEACLRAGADRVLLRVFGPPGLHAVSVLPAGVTPLLPRVIWPAEMSGYDAWLDAGTPTCGNLGALRRAAANGAVEADWPLNALNAHSAAALGDLGATFVWASPELSGRQLVGLAAASPLPVGCVVWGRTEMMVSEQCVLQASGACGRRCESCSRRAAWWHLRDQKGYRFPVTTDSSGRSHIMNAVTLDLTRALDEVLAAGVAAVRLDFTDEEPNRAAGVVASVRSALTAVVAGASPPAEPLAEPATSGHFYRGLL